MKYKCLLNPSGKWFYQILSGDILMKIMELLSILFAKF